jgi:hypothetical protein
LTSNLAIRVLGDFAVNRDGADMALPQSRKTRALLAYLALGGRSFRREHLCELLWEIPDDPRGSLRWSLSKLRRLVDDETRERIVADRLTVRFDPADVPLSMSRRWRRSRNGTSLKHRSRNSKPPPRAAAATRSRPRAADVPRLLRLVHRRA